MVGLRLLEPSILVRVQVPQHQSEHYRVTEEPYFTIYMNNKYPWDSTIETKDLLLQLIKNSDETEKVDFKLDLNIQGSKQEKKKGNGKWGQPLLI
jgi:hypothetical protein